MPAFPLSLWTCDECFHAGFWHPLLMASPPVLAMAVYLGSARVGGINKSNRPIFTTVMEAWFIPWSFLVLVTLERQRHLGHQCVDEDEDDGITQSYKFQLPCTIMLPFVQIKQRFRSFLYSFQMPWLIIFLTPCHFCACYCRSSLLSSSNCAERTSQACDPSDTPPSSIVFSQSETLFH